jgi:hypothetical protein
MTAQTEFINKAFDQTFDCFRKATGSTLQMQQDFLRQCFTAWPTPPSPQTALNERVQKYHKESSKAAAEFIRKWQESWDRQYQSAMKALEEAFHVAEAKDADELRKKTEELWHKSFDTLKEVTEAQMKDFQEAVAKWIEMTTKWAS